MFSSSYSPYTTCKELQSKIKDQKEIIAKIKTDFPTKFAIPRQSGILNELESRIVFEGKYKNPDYIRGIEGFSHLWLIWCFSENAGKGSSPTVRPPRLGGNKRNNPKRLPPRHLPPPGKAAMRVRYFSMWIVKCHSLPSCRFATPPGKATK